MKIKESVLFEVLKGLEKEYPCCQFGSVPIISFPNREKDFFRIFMPDTVSAIVVAHHVVTMKEWTSYQPPEGVERCDADDHTFEVCRRIERELKKYGYQSKIVPYPYESGLQFRYVAQSAGIGYLGKNAFLIHPEWGAWVHLRVLSTTAPTEKGSFFVQTPKDVCGDCTRCIDSCPAGALTHGFNGLVCRKYRTKKGEYIPVGEKRVYKYCLICALVCPLGKKPEG